MASKKKHESMLDGISFEQVIFPLASNVTCVT